MAEMDFPAVVFFRRPLNDASEQELDKIIKLLKENKSLTAQAKKELLLYAQFSKGYRKNRKMAASKELLSIYSKYCDDEKIKLEVRLQAFGSNALKIIFRAKTAETNKLFFKVCNLVGQSKDINAVSSLLYEYMGLLFAANDKAPGWQQSAKSLIKPLELYYEKSPDRFKISENSYNYYSIGLVSLYCATGNIEKTQSFINKIPRLKQRMETYFILLKYHQIDLASKLFKKSYKQIDKPTRRWSAVCKGDINIAQKKFLEKMADDKDAVYTAKLYLAFVKYLSKEMRQVAGEFAAEGPQDKSLRKEILGMLLTNNYTKKAAMSFSSELFTTLDPGLALSDNNSHLRQTYAAHLLSKIASSKSEELLKVYKKINSASNKSRRRDIVRYLADNIIPHFNSDALTAASCQENIDKYIALGTALVGKAAEINDGPKLFFTTFILMHIKGDTEALSQWVDGLDAKQLKGANTYYFKQSLVVLDKMFSDKQGKTDKAKVNAAKLSLLSSPILKKVFAGNKSSYDSLKRSLSESFTRNLKSLDDLHKLKGLEVFPLLIKSTNAKIIYNCFKTSLSHNLKKSVITTSDKKDLVYLETIEQLRKILPKDINVVGGNFCYAITTDYYIRDYAYVQKGLESIENKGDWLKEIYVNILYSAAKKKKVEQGPVELVKYYTQFFKNDKIPLDQRLNIYYSHKNYFNCPLRAEVAFTILDLLAESKTSDSTQKNISHCLLEHLTMC
ncbi:MAG: hypothetical protein HRT88_20975, partial [Lentisphaeraceae bacterium]|nr:hypothetical protein [Lentisphaeraceae bacterium]